MAGDNAHGGDCSGPPPGDGEGGGPGALQRLSLRTKALVIANEFTHRQMEPDELRGVLVALAPTEEERRRVGQAVEQELRAARYPVGEILRLIGRLLPKGADGTSAPPPVADDVVVTRKVRSPSLMPFDKVEFEAEEPAPDEEAGGAAAAEVEPPSPEQTSGAPSAEPGADTQVVVRDAVESPDSGGGERRRSRGLTSFQFVKGGETAPFTPSQFKGLGQQKAPVPEPGRQIILIADDDARTRMVYRVKLEESGFATSEATDGIEAWDQIRSGAVQCAVMDMKMPGYHGLEILSRMVDANLIIPVVVVSAFDQLQNEFVVATYPKLTFLTKPASPDQVAEAVRAFLRPGKRVVGS
jgi:CheY-like chemotaxis protein